MVMDTQIQIGKKISDLRKAKGWSQENLAKKLGISRSSLAQAELGNRSIDIIEFQKFAYHLEFSIAEFLSKEGMSKEVMLVQEETVSYQSKERISIPALRIDKFRNVLLYILERCAGKPNVGETVLYKLLYFADFNYYEYYEEHLSGARYRKLPYGPVPQDFQVIINQMIQESLLKRVKTEYHKYTQTRYLPLVKPNLTLLKASEKDILDKVIDQMSDWSATSISEYSHRDMPWLASKDGEEINYELVFYRETPYSVRNYDEEVEN